MFYVTIYSPRGTVRLPRNTRAEAEQKAAQVRASGYPVSIQNDEQAERETAPLIRPQPKRTSQNYVDGWDV